MLKPKTVKAVDAHTFTEYAEKVQTTFLGQRRGADGRIYATRDTNIMRSVLRNTKKLQRTVQNKRRGMLTSSVLVVLLHDNGVGIQLLALEYC
jgi:hypothetical protein